MKKLLKCKERGAFLSEDGGWTSDPAQARCFESDSEIREKAREFELRRGEIYYSFHDQGFDNRWDFALPL